MNLLFDHINNQRWESSRNNLRRLDLFRDSIQLNSVCFLLMIWSEICCCFSLLFLLHLEISLFLFWCLYLWLSHNWWLLYEDMIVLIFILMEWLYLWLGDYWLLILCLRLDLWLLLYFYWFFLLLFISLLCLWLSSPWGWPVLWLDMEWFWVLYLHIRM